MQADISLYIFKCVCVCFQCTQLFAHKNNSQNNGYVNKLTVITSTVTEMSSQVKELYNTCKYVQYN